MITLAAIINATGQLGYLLPALVGLESLGIPSPGETALVLAAVLASQGKLQIELVIAIAVAAAIVGDNIGYVIGRLLGREVLEAPGPLQPRRVKLIATGDRFFAKHGSKAVFLGRWVSLVRVVVAWMAGIMEMPFLRFFFWNALGGLTWATTVGLLAYYGGKTATQVLSKVGLIAGIAFGVVAVAGLVFWKVRERRRRVEDDPAREPAPPTTASEEPE
jgi:membrane protein DedA with SNARE-associated domain